MNMFKDSGSKSIAEYIGNVPDDRKDIIIFLDEFIKKNAPTLEPHFASNMLGYGKFTYKGRKNEDLEWPVIALANQKNYVSVYACAVVDGEYVAEKYKNELGNVNVGRSCIRFNKLDKLNLDGFKKVLNHAVKTPGLVPASK